MSAQTPPADGFGLYLATISVGCDDDADDDFAERYREQPDDEDAEGDDDARDAPVDAGCATGGAGLGAPAGGAVDVVPALTLVPFGFSWAQFPY